MIAYHHTLAPDSLHGPVLDRYLAKGWYRMHQNIFTTTHVVKQEFYRVHWLRYLLGKRREHASHRRIINRNKSFRYIIEDFSGIRRDHEELYARYRATIDFEGALSIQQGLFGEAGVDKHVYKTHSISVFDKDLLVAGGYFDVGEIAGTSILHFFDPNYREFSLGKYLILLTADFLSSAGHQFYYPGYVVAGDDKMDYKLFMGEEATQYFDPGSGRWKYFEKAILVREALTAVEELELLMAFGPNG